MGSRAVRRRALARRLREFWALYSSSRLGVFGLAVILFYVFLALAAPLVAPYDPDEFVGRPLEGPSWEHPLGTDQMGRDLLSRLVHGTRVSLTVGLAASAMAVLIGSVVGLVSGYFGGVIDTVLMRITDVFIQLPALPLMLIFVAILGKGIFNIVLVIAILGWTATARMVRSQTLSLKERPFVEAARAVGASDLQILATHIAPNVVPLIFANATISVVNAILSESFLSFLGFGDPRIPSWGMLLYYARMAGAVVNGFWWFIVPPGVAIMTLALGFACVNYSLDQILNPRLRRR
ncbi:MAG: ABC transporter permease [Thermoproteota archaeon]|nr:MAG: ABC transporter permease [Candidatus Korarchaeota archaeon]